MKPIEFAETAQDANKIAELEPASWADILQRFSELPRDVSIEMTYYEFLALSRENHRALTAADCE